MPESGRNRYPLRCFTAVLLGLASAVTADTVILKNGTRLEGEVRRTDAGWTIVAADGTVSRVSGADVASVELKGDRGDGGAVEKLASLRRAVETQSDLDEIIQRFERFIAANAGTPPADDAARDLATWRDRKARGMVKVGARWMTAAERATLLEQVHPMIDDARRLIAAGQYRDAEPLVTQVLALDAKHISALYLRGLVLYQQEKLPLARKAFEAVNAEIAEHAPTLNNLAVVSFRQNQQLPALNYFDQAMLAAPADRTILDNVAEALHALRDDQQKSAVARKVTRRFEDQDVILAAEMQKQDLYRWGATWVSKAQFDELKKAESAIAGRIDQLKVEFDTLTREIDSLERQIEATDRNIKRIEADSYFVDTNGNFVRLPLPALYYDEQRRLQSLRSQRAQSLAQQKVLQQQARRVEEDLPIPRYSGTQKLIGPEGTPVDDSPAGASTRPASRS